MMNKYATVFWSFQTSPTMKLLLAAIVLVFLVEANAQWYKFPAEAARGQPLDLWHLLLWTKLSLPFLTLTVHDCVQDLVICGEHTGIWGRPTGRTRTNTFMPEETMTLPEEDQGANGPQRWSGECSYLCSLSDCHVVLLLMHVCRLQQYQGVGTDENRPRCQRLCCWSGCEPLGSEWRQSQCLQTTGTS